MKNRRVCLVLMMVLLTSVTSGQQSARVDLEMQLKSAQQKELVDGDLKGAIELYKKIAQGNDRAIAAKALIHMAGCYEKLGQSDARNTYERVIREFADQAESAGIARTRLSALADNTQAAAGSETVVRRVWAGADVEVNGAPTRDGRYLTFTDWETGDLAVRDLTTGEKRRLTNKGTWMESLGMALSSVPSPDGRRVAYVWSDKEVELRLVGLDGSASRVLYRNPDLSPEPVDWSPDGTQILALLTGKNRTNQIALVSAADGSVRVLKTLDWRHPAKMSFSPDGKYIVYDLPTREETPARDIFVLASDGSRESVLVTHPAHDFVLGWAPDGKHVVFASDRTGTLSVWAAPIEGDKPAGEPKLIRISFASGATAMGFTKNGSFYYGVNAPAGDVYLASLDLATGKVSTPPAKVVEHFVGANSGAGWSRDGRSLVYQSRRSPVPNASPLLVIRTMATGTERTISTKLTSVQRPIWSPDGRSIFLGAKDEKGMEGFYRVDVPTGEVTAVVTGNEGGCARHPAGFSSDGESIICLHQDFANRTFRVVSQDLKSGQTRDLFRSTSTIYPVVVSNDGRQAAFGHWGSGGGLLQVVSTAGGEPREVYRFENRESTQSLAWSADGRHLFFAKILPGEETSPEQQKRPLWRVPVMGGAPVETGLTMDRLRDIRPHPDGQRIAFTSGHRSAEVWVIENFLPKAESPTRPK